MDENVQVSSYCSKTFTNLDRWLNQVSEEKGEGAMQHVREMLRNNIAANITYYEEIAKRAEKNGGQNEIAARNTLIAKMYRGLLD